MKSKVNYTICYFSNPLVRFKSDRWHMNRLTYPPIKCSSNRTTRYTYTAETGPYQLSSLFNVMHKSCMCHADDLAFLKQQ
ncbi:hypothetical protein BLOT_000605 [Blomia tropicalis]|nr:hypothetical protein BLOT_000605 [Blomia tropicalis]